MTETRRPTRVALDADEALELDRLARMLDERGRALDEARTALAEAAGRIAARYDRGGPAAVAARVGWSRQHVSTLAAAHRRGTTADDVEAA
ncbi:hypothetical protein OHB36_33515 [Streptomyces sp. NBC_00320]|uniref:hypothetical protein n=1 Tax=unclassified Streptomyces TaxID=2593676 RepID=UPI0022522585|nr:hypothetical protein [Streptomyces sp. NBC_00320]MCX5151619.1 hypothetical protein [Streptomyces sp. NBC_00320]